MLQLNAHGRKEVDESMAKKVTAAALQLFGLSKRFSTSSTTRSFFLIMKFKASFILFGGAENFSSCNPLFFFFSF